MQSNLYIPSKIRIGFQNRADTYTGKLGFVTYKDSKGILRQEKSWDGWRDKNIESKEYENKPSQFVFNKNVQRTGYWSTNTKVRIYDTRDFEFEIDVSNMMYILMHSDVSKRDILEECVFAWAGKNLILLPINSDEYRVSVENTKKMNTKFSLKDLNSGHVYSTKNSGDAIYLGHYDWSEERYEYVNYKRVMVNVGKKHIFHTSQGFLALNGTDLVEDISKEVHPNFASLLEKLMKNKGMQKTGKWIKKKDFEKTGYKKTAYEFLKVTLFQEQKDFQIEELTLSIYDDKPLIKKAQNSYYYIKDRYLREMKQHQINMKDMQQIKEFFIKKGFGDLYYQNIKGEEVKI